MRNYVVIDGERYDVVKSKNPCGECALKDKCDYTNENVPCTIFDSSKEVSLSDTHTLIKHEVKSKKK